VQMKSWSTSLRRSAHKDSDKNLFVFYEVCTSY
jgi:hypothetical protein